MSYLDSPRLHFSGFFQADVSTINNDVRYYDNAAFQPDYQVIEPPGKGAWNPEGTAIFRFVSCRVTSACLGSRVFTDPAQDPVVGLALENADQRVSGKLVDLDPQQQAVSEIWGLQVRLTDGLHKALFGGDYLTAAFINLWRRQQKGLPTDQKLAAVYQSVLRDVSWQGHAGSTVLAELQRASAPGWLSIDMNVYGYGRDPKIPRYTLGHVTGTIGPYAHGEPKHFVLGRQMAAAGQDPTVPDGGVYFFQCQLHPERHTLTADFGNCLQIEDADGPLTDVGTLSLAVLKRDTETLLTTVAAGEIASLGEVPYREPGWYSRTAGVVDFDYGADAWLRDHIADHPLLLVSPRPDGSYQVRVQESLGGLYVRADSYVLRLQPGQKDGVELFASRWGRPLAAAVQLSATEGAMGGSGRGSAPLDPPVPIPDIGTPAGAVSYPARLQTDTAGRARLEVQAAPEGPGNPRGYIDGQLYGIAYQLAEQPSQTVANFWNYVSILVFDKLEVPERPTWYADVQPIFQQYGNLYPIMSRHLVDLADYDSVVRNLAILKLAFSLPAADPNHMPVTRDLSDARRALILKWMACPGPDGLPVKGEAAARRAAAPRATVPDVEVPLEPLQQAGKTAVLLEYEARQRAKGRRP